MLFSSVTGLPSTTSAAGVSTGFVRQLRRYYADVRLLADVHARIVLLASRADPAAGKPRMPARSLGSRACSFSTCSWLLDYAGPDVNSRLRSRQCGLPVASTRSAPELRFSKLNSRPVDASVYASPGTSRHPAQDSRSRWFATPFLWGSFIPDYTPVYPDACAPLRPGISACKHVNMFLSRARQQAGFGLFQRPAELSWFLDFARFAPPIALLLMKATER